MLKALLLLLMNLALAAMATAQTNLVPNGSFEDTVNCDIPTNSTLLKAAIWYNPNNATPDVWDCDLDRLCGMGMSPTSPNQGYQPSFDGTRHAGIFCWYGPGSSNTREYLGAPLTGDLVAGEEYEVSLRVARERTYIYAIDHLGVWFGADSLWQNTTWWLSVTPQAELRDPSQTYLEEGTDWVHVVDTIVASGSEGWMVVGNFVPAVDVEGTQVLEEGWPYAYYYIDQVEVKWLPGSAGVMPPKLTSSWAVNGLEVKWPASETPRSLTVYDGLGRVVHRSDIPDTTQREVLLSSADWSSGFYTLELVGRDTRLVSKVIKGEGGF